MGMNNFYAVPVTRSKAEIYADGLGGVFFNTETVTSNETKGK